MGVTEAVETELQLIKQASRQAVAVIESKKKNPEVTAVRSWRFKYYNYKRRAEDELSAVNEDELVAIDRLVRLANQEIEMANAGESGSLNHLMQLAEIDGYETVAEQAIKPIRQNRAEWRRYSKAYKEWEFQVEESKGMTEDQLDELLSRIIWAVGQKANHVKAGLVSDSGVERQVVDGYAEELLDEFSYDYDPEEDDLNRALIDLGMPLWRVIGDRPNFKLVSDAYRIGNIAGATKELSDVIGDSIESWFEHEVEIRYEKLKRLSNAQNAPKEPDKPNRLQIPLIDVKTAKMGLKTAKNDIVRLMDDFAYGSYENTLAHVDDINALASRDSECPKLEIERREEVSADELVNLLRQIITNFESFQKGGASKLPSNEVKIQDLKSTTHELLEVATQETINVKKLERAYSRFNTSSFVIEQWVRSRWEQFGGTPENGHNSKAFRNKVRQAFKNSRIKK